MLDCVLVIKIDAPIIGVATYEDIISKSVCLIDFLKKHHYRYISQDRVNVSL